MKEFSITNMLFQDVADHVGVKLHVEWTRKIINGVEFLKQEVWGPKAWQQERTKRIWMFYHKLERWGA